MREKYPPVRHGARQRRRRPSRLTLPGARSRLSAMAPTTDWNPLLRGEFEKEYWASLMSFVASERDRFDIFPPPDEVFAALHLTPCAAVKVVILGQDPYHGPGQAHGLST